VHKQALTRAGRLRASRALLTVGVVLAPFILAACATSTPAAELSSAPSTAASAAVPVDCKDTTVSVQSWGTDGSGTQAVLDTAAAYSAQTGNPTEVNSVAIETFRTQLPTYLTSENPPDALKWLAGSTSKQYADAGLLMDVSDLWANQLKDFSPALKSLSTDSSGKQFFVPTNYYWWGMFYRPSVFQEHGYAVPTTWEEFTTLSKKMQDDGLTPIAIGTSGSEWVATAWFDYLDLRINGAEFHRELLAGKHKFTDPEVRKVFEYWAQIQPYMDPNSSGQGFVDALTPFFQGKAGMTLMGAFLPVPEAIKDDIDFFAFPMIDPNIPRAEEAPTDGLFASAKSGNPECAKEFLAGFVTPENQQAFLSAGGGIQIGANPAIPDSFYPPLAVKGREHLQTAAEITQFFDRDSSQEFAGPANAANAQFIVQPDKVDEILNTWQAAAEKVLASQPTQ
jgi:multiple sugar transport system substrate-binding protein